MQCAICEKVVPRPWQNRSRPEASVCGEECLAEMIVRYWTRRGRTAQVAFDAGYPRIVAIQGLIVGPGPTFTSSPSQTEVETTDSRPATSAAA